MYGVKDCMSDRYCSRDDNVSAEVAEATSTYVRVKSLLVRLYACVMSLNFNEYT